MTAGFGICNIGRRDQGTVYITKTTKGSGCGAWYELGSNSDSLHLLEPIGVLELIRILVLMSSEGDEKSEGIKWVTGTIIGHQSYQITDTRGLGKE